MTQIPNNQSSCLNSKMLTDICLLLGEDAEDFIPDLIRDYFQSSQDLLNNLEDAIAPCHFGIASLEKEKILINAHSLGSSSATLGAMNLAKYCHQMELVARNGEHEKYQTLFKEIKSEYSNVVSALTQILHQEKTI